MPAIRRILAVLTVLGLSASAFVPTPAASAAPIAGARPRAAKIRLARPLNGPGAVKALGANAARVARLNRRTTAQMARLLRTDPSVWIDRGGRLHYREPVPPASALSAPSDAGSAAPLAPLEETFALHSKPGSKRVIYLDFDGHVLQDTGWNDGTIPDPVVCPPWNVEGSPDTFGDSERTLIQRVWQRVAEDYAPFDVDVTTEAPLEAAITRDSTGDEYYGMRVLVSPIASYFGNYGGYAYIGVFNDVGDRFKPALVFPEKLGNDEKYIGEAAAHECGHTLGLDHDGTTAGTVYYRGHGSGGTTETGWAPIMGSGYYQNVTQWSRGEYYAANNTQDDLAIISSFGCALRADDHGDNTGAATQVGSGTDVTASGVIASADDLDAVSFVAGAGPLTLTVSPAALGPDLDILAKLYGPQGELVAESNPAGALGANVSATVSEGRYVLVISGTGVGTPLAATPTGYTNYGSLGSWTLLGSVFPIGPVEPPTAAITASPTVGIAPLPVTFDGRDSVDPDGTIVTWAWDFGDGAKATGATASHVYATPGTYHPTLTVTDATGLTGQVSTQVTVSPPPLHVDGLSVSTTRVRGGWSARARVRVVSAGGGPVSGASVRVTWSGPVVGTSVGTTDANGNLTLASRAFRGTGVIGAAIAEVSKPMWIHDAAADTISSASAVLVERRSSRRYARPLTAGLQDEHRVAERQEPVALLHRGAVRGHDRLASREGAHHHHQGRAWHVEVRDQRVHSAEVVAGQDEQPRRRVCLGHAVRVVVPRALEGSDRGRAHRDHPTASRARVVDLLGDPRRHPEVLAVHHVEGRVVLAHGSEGIEADVQLDRGDPRARRGDALDEPGREVKAGGGSGGATLVAREDGLVLLGIVELARNVRRERDLPDTVHDVDEPIGRRGGTEPDARRGRRARRARARSSPHRRRSIRAPGWSLRPGLARHSHTCS